MMSERQLAETLCFYYGYDAESDRIVALPIVQRCCCGQGHRPAAGARLLKSSVWRQTRVSQACVALRRCRPQQVRCCRSPTTATSCCTTEACKLKCNFKRRSSMPKSSFMRQCSASVVPRAKCRFVASGGEPRCRVICGGGVINLGQNFWNGLCPSGCHTLPPRPRVVCDVDHAATAEPALLQPDLRSRIHSPSSAVFCPSSTSSTFIEPAQPATCCLPSPSPSTSASSCHPSPSPCPHDLPASPTSSACSDAHFLHLWYPSESLDWREWIDEVVEEVRNEIFNENLFQPVVSPGTSSQSSSEAPNSQSRKRKHDQFAAPSSVDSGVSSSSSSSSPPPPVGSAPAKRAKKYSLASLSHEQVAERKKEQNRIAAQRYRSRKTQTLEEGRAEIGHLEKRNADLRLEMYALEREIRAIKQQLVGRELHAR